MGRDSGRADRAVTQLDVARRAQVSRALVSIVMRGAPGASPAARERILQAAVDLGYRPDARARSLAGSHSRMIGVMFGVSAGTFPFALLDGLFAAAEDHRQSLIMAPITPLRDEHRAMEALRDFRFGGLVMLSPPTPYPLLAGRIPLAVIGWQVDHPAVDVIRTDDDGGIAAAVDHLVTLGHRRITHIDGGASAIADARRNAYKASMRRHGLERYVQVITGGQTAFDGHRAAQQLLDDNDLPTAVVSYNDDTAVAAINQLLQHGIGVPGQMSITGFDDSEALAISPVRVTTVAQQAGELGRLAVERLMDRIGRNRIRDREIVLAGRLMIRASTAPPRER